VYTVNTDKKIVIKPPEKVKTVNNTDIKHQQKNSEKKKKNQHKLHQNCRTIHIIMLRKKTI